MSIEKTSIVDKIEITENGCVQVRTAIRVVEDGKIIAQKFERHVIEPGQEYGSDDQRVQAICAATHTPEVIAAYKAAIAAQGV